MAGQLGLMCAGRAASRRIHLGSVAICFKALVEARAKARVFFDLQASTRVKEPRIATEPLFEWRKLENCKWPLRETVEATSAPGMCVHTREGDVKRPLRVQWGCVHATLRAQLT